MSKSQNQPLNPLASEVEHGGVAQKAFQVERAKNPSRAMWLGLGSLVLVALAVVFVLPEVVSKYELPLERRFEELPNSSVAPQAPTVSVSPFEAAQQSMRRQEAQNVLEGLLNSQKQLEALEVRSWANDLYEEALGLAAAGDDAYRNQEFVSAIQSYELGASALSELLENLPTSASRLLEEAEKAFNNSDASLAIELYTVALVLQPQNQDALIGLERSRVLDDVVSMIDEGNALLQSGNLTEALDMFRLIVGLDTRNEYAQSKISEIEAQILEIEFASIMSEGYALRQRGQLTEAIETFLLAAGIGIRESDALAALQQVETQIANERIRMLNTEILEAESEERWQDAVDAYDEALIIDPNLLFAIEGLKIATQRATLDRLLNRAIEEPLRLSEQSIYEESLRYYFIGRDIDSPGSLLSSQLDKLQSLLEIAKIPRTVTFVSDNLTNVTLLRVRDLGVFSTTSLELTPGEYVAVGRREGYRDTRKEFVVGFDGPTNIVSVECLERIASAIGRR